MTDDAVSIEDGGTLAGVPDAFQRLWTPHRMVYIAGENKPADATEGNCPFCTAPGRDDADGLIVHRGEHVLRGDEPVPVLAGAPAAVPLPPHQRLHRADARRRRPSSPRSPAQAMTVLREVVAPAGFNLGINQGQVAGAGITAHLHQHVVPRWLGDANFLPVIAQTKALPVLLEDSRQQLAAAWAKL